MVDVPAATAVTSPAELTVATPVALEVHEPPVLPLEVNCEVPATQIACVPAKVPALGGAVTVTVRVDELEHPVPVTVYVIVVVPAATPVTKPELLTVATDAVLVDQVPPELPSVVN